MNGTIDAGRGRIRVGVLEAHKLLREGLESLIEHTPSFECVGAWEEAEQALGALPDAAPEVLLVDVGLPRRAAIHFLDALPSTRPGARVVALVDCVGETCPLLRLEAPPTFPHGPCLLSRSSASPPGDCREIAVHLHAHAVLRKQSPFERVAEAIHSVFDGQAWPISPEAVLPEAGVGMSRAAGLTPREREVMALVAEGYSNKQIAVGLGLAYSTVKNHVSSILEKLGLQDRTQIAVYVLSRSKNVP